MYIKRHDRVCAQMHTSQESKVNILCNQQEKTDRNMHNDKTDSITRDNKTGVCVLNDIAVSGNGSVMKKEALSGHKSLVQGRSVEKKIAHWRLILVDPHYVICFMSFFLALRILRWLPDRQKTCGPLL